MTHPNTEQLIDLVESANQNPEDPSTNRLIIAQEIAALGFYMIGTAESQEVHMPRKQTYYDRNLIHDDGTPAEISFFEDPDVTFIRATWSGKLALEGAILGDFNVRDQRVLLGKPLTNTPRMYGWQCRTIVLADAKDNPESEALHEINDDDLLPHAEQALLSAVNDNVEGYIDVVSEDGFYDVGYDFVDPESTDSKKLVLQPGLVFGFEPKKTITTLTVRGSDLWYTGINSMEYRKHTTS